jgi:hypothetical protein
VIKPSVDDPSLTVVRHEDDSRSPLDPTDVHRALWPLRAWPGREERIVFAAVESEVQGIATKLLRRPNQRRAQRCADGIVVKGNPYAALVREVRGVAHEAVGDVDARPRRARERSPFVDARAAIAPRRDAGRDRADGSARHAALQRHETDACQTRVADEPHLVADASSAAQ